ncbi:hypothetical protein ABT260_003060 [Acinetobacter baumannii]|uniref:hypothetical protein n=1 Tax=Acinetobacter baumannii TaxID=470 RepID=UPI0004497B93|nr:hypothetical protein [Acinetobacter baumannii]EXD50006.1 hypothetical protein J498_3756 [Acinetobacter baumannii 781407]EXE23174.1 hypothetical protein J564_3875 [Acinetobacter baumannii 1525283]MBJ9772905.1 hypothetical protein [Acinetobacter baumannii]MDC4734729.1 hypothetical protein [Acinetobacter baumannii]MDC4803997.1 hypothetical protein [Acinetobacter baumannii]
MSVAENFSNLLPNYLSDATREKLEINLKDFSANEKITQDPFTPFKNDFFLQGDIIVNVPYPYWDSGCFKTVSAPRCIILSNTCDIDERNSRAIPMDCLLAPIFSVEKYETLMLKNGVGEDRVQQFISNVKRYKITNLFHLPINEEGEYEPHGKGYIVALDKAFSLPRNVLNIKQHLKSLNQFFSYLFTFHLSIHLCRFHDKVDRNENKCY